ncbi:hypothetical protein WNY61_07845 [Sulfitobacter sp. AS92]|uniref:site-specific integrase n=1 Tax=Sulfitobacter sp. AS92 TaxID=3135783 RepID=UPI00316B6181
MPKKMFLCFSLRIHVLSEAKILTRRLTEMSDLVFAADAEKMMAIAPDIQAIMLENLARFEIEAFERTRAVAAPRCLEAAASDLRREEVLQRTLREALYLGDREIARNPLRHVATQLGVELNDRDEDWTALAYEATRVLLDVSQERARRQQGIYNQPTVFFRRALSTEVAAAAARPIGQTELDISPAAFASDDPLSASRHTAPTTKAEPDTAAIPVQATATPMAGDLPEQAATASTEMVGQFKGTTALTPCVVPADLDMPQGYDEESWQKARIAARPPRILVNRSLLSEGSRAALEKQRGITLTEAIELYFELQSWGYSAPFSKAQRVKPVPEELKSASLEDRLNEDHRGKLRLARDLWPALLGDGPVDEISTDEMNDALEVVWRVPANHARSAKDRDQYTLLERVERADLQRAQLKDDIKAAVAEGATAEKIDKMRLEGHLPRISVTTYIKHGRVLRAIGEMLWDMQLIDHDPFAICSWTNDDVKELKSDEGRRQREPWDDRFDNLLQSPIYQNPLKDVGDPLFWAPLIARFMGMRMEEILQLGPEDFGSDKGIPYLRVRNTIINGLKTLSSERTLPIHPQLIELGLLKLVNLRKKQDHIRLFPFLNRGKQKGTFSANFSKAFGYYRRTNDCYWPGMDFHSLRTTFHHDLLGDDQSDAIRCRLMGHTRNDEGDQSYGQSLNISKLANRLKSVVVDISMIQPPFEEVDNTAPQPGQKNHLRVVG